MGSCSLYDKNDNDAGFFKDDDITDGEAEK